MKTVCCLHINGNREGGIALNIKELQQCAEICERLKQALKNADEIPADRLSGGLREALRETRRFQKEKMNEISNKIFN